MKRNTGFSLIEVLVAAIILALVAAGVAGVYASLQQLGARLTYRYTGLNLAKEVMEFGESGSFQHNLGMKYYYKKATSNTIENMGSCEGWGINGTNHTVGYKIKEWKCFILSLPDPFDNMGDIKARGLVPKGAPDSVNIYWKAKAQKNITPCPAGGNCNYSGMAVGGFDPFKQTVEITWKETEEPGEAETSEEIAVIPIRHVNTQLQLLTAEFWWD